VLYAFLERGLHSSALTPAETLHGVWCVAKACPLPLPRPLMHRLYLGIMEKPLTESVKEVAKGSSMRVRKDG